MIKDTLKVLSDSSLLFNLSVIWCMVLKYSDLSIHMRSALGGEDKNF